MAYWYENIYTVGCNRHFLPVTVGNLATCSLACSKLSRDCDVIINQYLQKQEDLLKSLILKFLKKKSILKKRVLSQTDCKSVILQG